jgi:protein-S-isoprenylcysteine O-methyltransferase Ste14
MEFGAAVHYSLLILWWGFIIFWLALGLFSSRAVKRQSWSSRLLTIVLGAIPFFLLFTSKLRLGMLAQRLYPDQRVFASAGVGLTAAGLAIAIWARLMLGRHWSATVTIKHQHQLICTGPYAVVRHPIYSGLLLALFGTAFVVGEVRGFAAVAIAFGAWFIKSRTEERFMVEKFGGEYEEYRRHTCAFVPYVL